MKSFAVVLKAGGDGRLYQRPIGFNVAWAKLRRDDEFYPQTGDGHV